MRINTGYRAARKAGKSARMAGQEVLNNTQGVAAYIRDKGQVAVQQLQRADAAYAEAVRSAFNTANKPMLDMMVATPLSDVRGMTATNAYEAAGGFGPRTSGEMFKGNAGDAALMASNVGARYALPAAGVALAAKGIGDVAFGGPSDQQEPNQLDVGNIAGLTAAGAGVAVAPGLVNQFRGRPNSAKSLLGMAALGAGGGALTGAIAQQL